MNILALDIGTHCGWAHSCGLSGTWDLSVKRDESSGMRLIRLRSKLREIFDGEGVDIVFFEAVRFAGGKTGRAIPVMGELQGVIKLWAELKKIPYKGLSSSEVKKFATGKGNAGKPAMKEAALKKWGGVVEGCDDNEVDAKWILELGKSLL
jgi:Holliday junction resolvasome RuvABC endonuclease subunit